MTGKGNAKHDAPATMLHWRKWRTQADKQCWLLANSKLDFSRMAFFSPLLHKAQVCSMFRLRLSSEQLLQSGLWISLEEASEFLLASWFLLWLKPFLFHHWLLVDGLFTESPLWKRGENALREPLKSSNVVPAINIFPWKKIEFFSFVNFWYFSCLFEVCLKKDRDRKGFF